MPVRADIMPKIMSQHTAAALEQAARILESGGLVVAPKVKAEPIDVFYIPPGQAK